MSLPISYQDIKRNIDIVETQEKKEKVEEEIKLKDVLFDFEKERFVYEGLEPKHIYTKKEIIKQWIKKLFYTERDRWNVYIQSLGYPFGLDIRKYVGQQLYPNFEIIELIKKDIYNSLMNNKDIKEVYGLQLIQIDAQLECGFIVELEDDAFEMEERLK